MEPYIFHLHVLLFLVPCVWGPWTEFSKCDKSCGGGKMVKTRTKVVEEKYGGYCDNIAEVVKDCNTQGCASKFLFIDWFFYVHQDKQPIWLHKSKIMSLWFLNDS